MTIQSLTENGTIARFHEIQSELKRKNLPILDRLNLMIEESRIYRQVLTIGFSNLQNNAA